MSLVGRKERGKCEFVIVLFPSNFFLFWKENFLVDLMMLFFVFNENAVVAFGCYVGYFLSVLDTKSYCCACFAILTYCPEVCSFTNGFEG